MSTSSNSTIITPPTAPISAAEAAAMMPTAKGGEVRTPDKDYFEALQTEVNELLFTGAQSASCIFVVLSQKIHRMW